MIRGLFVLVCFMVAWYALKTIIRSAVRAYHEKDEQVRNTRIKGHDMVLDPECRTYVVKDRAVSRRMRGETLYFCSESCARQHEDKHGT